MTDATNIKRYTSEQLQVMRAAGKSQTNMAAVRAKTKKELEQDIVSDLDWNDQPKDWYKNVVPKI